MASGEKKQFAEVSYTTDGNDLEPLPLAKLYFCVHCVKLKSRRCVMQELDSLYLPNELETVPSSDALMRKNRASNTYSCPVCHNSLQVSASGISKEPSTGPSQRLSPSPLSSKGVTSGRKYSFHCLVCQWISKDAGMEDATIASGGWQNTDPEDVPMITHTLNWYRKLLDISKMETERGKKKTAKKRYSVSDSAKPAPISSLSMKLETFEHASVAKHIDEFPDEIYTEKIPLHEITTLSQRFQQPLTQPRLISSLLPRRGHLVSKCSMRCRECEHNLCKPDFNPSLTRFKIHLVALHYVPNLRVVKIPALKLNEEEKLIMSLTNPLPYPVHVTLLPVEEEGVAKTAEVHFPEGSLLVSAREDLSESYDVANTFDDDPKIIHSRKGCRLEFYVQIKPLIVSGTIKFTCSLEHDYHMKSTMTFHGEAAKEDDTCTLRHYVNVSMGPTLA